MSKQRGPVERFSCLGILLLWIALLVPGCRSGEEGISPDPLPLVRTPANFPAPYLNPDNPMTAEGVALGRRLFYDKRLSGNNKVSCATCHDPAKSFSDGVALTNAGVSGTDLLRHTPALINLAWANNGLFWDGGSTNLESQSLAPLLAVDEMNQEIAELVEELKAVPEYVSGFRKAFDNEIYPAYIMMALAQFQRTLISADSRYDLFVRREEGGYLTPIEKDGLLLVQQHCQSCHSTDLFTDNKYHNNGLDENFPLEPHEGIFTGRYRISYDQKDMGAYKTPTLRNLALTAPYMHDGRMATIEDVIDHYSERIKPSGSRSPLLPKEGFQFSKQEKESILAFLKTLTDPKYSVNPAFSKP